MIIGIFQIIHECGPNGHYFETLCVYHKDTPRVGCATLALAALRVGFGQEGRVEFRV
jgi:hypothetical protein